MKQLRDWVLSRWILLLTLLALSLVTGFLLTYRLSSLVPGLSAEEQHYIQAQISGRQILNNPVFVFHKLPTYLLFKLHIHRISAYRAVSGILAASMVVSGFFILKRWYSRRIAILGSMLLASSALTLHVGRLATPDATFMMLLPLGASVLWMLSTRRRKLSLAILAVLIASSLYIPGFIWLLLALCTWQRKNLWLAIKKTPWWLKAAGGLLILISALPLIVASIHSPQNLLIVAGLPTHILSIHQIGINIVRIPMQLFFRGPTDPARWLGQLPILDAFSTVMLILGIYSLRYHLNKPRFKLLAGTTIMLTILIILGGIPLTALVPILYLLSAAGIAFMLQQWFTVFPRNPIARILATGLVSISVVSVMFYTSNQYFVAWPHSPQNVHVFKYKL